MKQRTTQVARQAEENQVTLSDKKVSQSNNLFTFLPLYLKLVSTLAKVD